MQRRGAGGWRRTLAPAGIAAAGVEVAEGLLPLNWSKFAQLTMPNQH
jgi:hypothetical protein